MGIKNAATASVGIDHKRQSTTYAARRSPSLPGTVAAELKGRRLLAQELLLPVRLEGIGEAEVERRRGSWAPLGIRVERGEDGVYAVTALPQELLCVEEELAGALAEGSAEPDELAHRVLSLAACRTAVKDGEELDPLTAGELARRALGLDNARCPHGRPIWMRIRREELLRAVARPQE